MTDNAMVITALCSHLCADGAVKPLELREWNALVKVLVEHDLEPKALLGLSEKERKALLSLNAEGSERIARLLDRGASLTFTLNKLQNAGVFVVSKPLYLCPFRGHCCRPV